MTTDSFTEGDATMPDGPRSAGVDVGVIGVSGSRGRSRGDRMDRSCWAAMEDYTALLGERTAMRALPVPLTYVDATTVVKHLLRLPTSMEAAFVIGLGAADSLTVQSATTAAGGPLVVTELDVVSAALAAAVVTKLRVNGVAPRQGRVAITGADYAPQLESVLRGAGAGTVNNFYQPDASALPVRRLMTYHHVLIDLTGTVSPVAAPGRTVSVPTDVFDFAALALPGLVSALCGHGYSTLPVGALSAAARAIALITPANRPLPDPHHRLLVPAVARHVSRVLAARSASP